MGGCGNGCPACPDGYGCVVKKNCVAYNGVPTCAHCAAFPCEEIVPEDWPDSEYDPPWVICPTDRNEHLAASYARQYRIRQAKHHLVSYLWQFGRGGELRSTPQPHMWMEKHEWKKRQQDISLIPTGRWTSRDAICLAFKRAYC